MYPPVIYWMSDWPLWLFLYFNTDFWVIQMQAFSIQILVGWSATLIISACQYWFPCQPNLCIHCWDIGWVIAQYDWSCIPILSTESAKCIHSAIKFRWGDQLLWLFPHSNIGFCVSQIYAFTVGILDEWLATMIIPVFQYWVLSQPNACIQQSNTGWVISYSDYFCIPILVSVSA